VMLTARCTGARWRGLPHEASTATTRRGTPPKGARSTAGDGSLPAGRPVPISL
jgi:hypothetical protein